MSHFWGCGHPSGGDVTFWPPLECIKSQFPAIPRKEIFVHGIYGVFGLLWTKPLLCLTVQPEQLSITWGSLAALVPDTAPMSERGKGRSCEGDNS